MDADDIRAWMADFLLDGPDPERQEAFEAALAADPELRAEWEELQAAAGMVDSLPSEAWGPVDLEAMRDRLHERLDDVDEGPARDHALAELTAEPPVPDEELAAPWPELLQACAWVDLLPAPDLDERRLAMLKAKISQAVATDEAV